MRKKKYIFRFFHWSYWSIEAIIRLVYFCLGAILIIAFTYVFGFHILVGTLKGGDGGHAYHNVYWYAKWFPQIPLWYPFEGGGYSFTLNYSLGSILTEVFVHYFGGFDISQSLRLVTFGSFLLGALGVYFLGAWRFRNQTVGLIGALIFLTLPGNWFWITKLGYYANGIATNTVPWGFIFFDWFLESLIVNRNKTKIVFSLFLASVFLGISMLTHAFTGVSLAIGYFIYGPIVGAIRTEKILSLKNVLKNFFLGLFAATLACFVMFLLFSFWLLPVLDYSKQSAAGGPQAQPGDLIVRWAQVQNPSRILFDWGKQPQSDQFPLPPFPRIVTYLLLVGLVLSLFFRSKALGLGVVGLFFLGWSGLPSVINRNLVEQFRTVFSYLNFYSFTVSNSILPLVAAFGIYATAWLVTEIPFVPFYFFKQRKFILLRIVKGFLVTLVSLLVFVNLLVVFDHGINGKDFYGFGAPEDPVGTEKDKLGYKGTYFGDAKSYFALDSRLLSPTYYQNLVQHTFVYSAALKMLAHPPVLSSAGYGMEDPTKKLASHMQLDQFSRVGLSGQIGSILQEWNTFTPASTLNQFHYQGSLFQAMRGFSETVFFGKDPRNHNSTLLDNLTKYIGYKYVVTFPNEDTKHYLPASWNIAYKDPGITIFQPKEYQGLATVTKRPVVLVIGSSKGAYENVFRSFATGLLPYDNAWLVQGGDSIDSYSLSELKKFDGVVLYGYTYFFGPHAFSLLDNYVKDGGRLFVDTGWQFVSKDWESPSAPSVFPVTGLKWTTSVAQGTHTLSADQASVLGISEMPLEWNGQAWGISTPIALRDWAKPLLTLDGVPVMVGGNYGKGQVIWSGFNLFGYLGYQRYTTDLMNAFSHIFLSLFPQSYTSEHLTDLSLSRNYPDNVSVSSDQALADGGWLMWREGYSHFWHAALETGNFSTPLRTYRAGVGFLLVRVPPTQGPFQVSLSYSLGFTGFFAISLSLISIVVLFMLFVDQAFFRGKLLVGFIRRSHLTFQSIVPKNKRIFKNPISHIKNIVSTDGEEDY